MGEVISRKASVDRIVEAYLKTVANANARGGEVKAMAEARLASLQGPISENRTQREHAIETAEQLHAMLMARDAESDLETGAVLDEIWNALGRPAHSPEYALIAGEGKLSWTGGDPVRQPAKMMILASNIRSADHKALQSRKESWAQRLELKGAAQAEAAKPLEAADTLVTALSMRARALANAAQVSMTRLKRDYKNAGMTEAQIHQIIPDVPKSQSPSEPEPPR